MQVFGRGQAFVWLIKNAKPNRNQLRSDQANSSWRPRQEGQKRGARWVWPRRALTSEAIAASDGKQIQPELSRRLHSQERLRGLLRPLRAATTPVLGAAGSSRSKTPVVSLKLTMPQCIGIYRPCSLPSPALPGTSATERGFAPTAENRKATCSLHIVSQSLVTASELISCHFPQHTHT